MRVGIATDQCGGLRLRQQSYRRGAGLVLDHFSAQGVEDDHMNIICLGGRIVGPEAACDLIQTFLEAEASRAERHLRR